MVNQWFSKPVLRVQAPLFLVNTVSMGITVWHIMICSVFVITNILAGMVNSKKLSSIFLYLSVLILFYLVWEFDFYLFEILFGMLCLVCICFVISFIILWKVLDEQKHYTIENDKIDLIFWSTGILFFLIVFLIIRSWCIFSKLGFKHWYGFVVCFQEKFYFYQVFAGNLYSIATFFDVLLCLSIVAITLGQILNTIRVIWLNQEVGADNHSAFVVKKKK